MIRRKLIPDRTGILMRMPGRMLIWLTGFASLTAFSSQAAGQTVENVLAELDNNDRDALITYDLLSNQPEQYRIGLYYSLDNGANFVAAPDALSGNVGVAVTPGLGRSIRWTEFSDTLSANVGSQVVFRVVAQPDAGEFVIQFTETMTSATEGQGTAYLQLVSSNPFFGKVRYEVSAMSDAQVGVTADSDVLPLSGEFEMTGTVGTIPVTIFDDFSIEDSKALTVDLVYDESLGYTVGPIFRQMLVLYDDDGYWNGVMTGHGESDGELPFRLAMASKDGVTSGVLISNKQSPTAISAFPSGTWPMNITFNGGIFSAQSNDIDVPESSLFPQAKGLKRRLTLEADPATSGVVRHNETIVGQFHDDTVGTGQRLSYLGSNTFGTFFMMRQLPTFVSPPVPILPPPPPPIIRAGEKSNAAEATLVLKGGDAR